jgi:hypothetical protein
MLIKAFGKETFFQIPLKGLSIWCQLLPVDHKMSLKAIHVKFIDKYKK